MAEAEPAPSSPPPSIAASRDGNSAKTPSQRALELRKFFEPFYPSSAAEDGLEATIHSDGALDAFAETVVWRLRGVRAMVSLIDRTTQYFLAGATRNDEGSTEDMSLERAWFGCSNIPTPGGLCENTMAIDRAADMYPCFIVNDLRQDDRFANLPVVDGSITAYRFYAGVPITTDHGVNIGSFFMFDDKPRAEGLSVLQRKFLHQAATNVMTHLETKREAAERRREALMSKGIARFLETTSRITEADLEAADASEKVPTHHTARESPSDTDSSTMADPKNGGDGNGKGDEETIKSPSARVLDQIKLTLDHAAEIIRESLELRAGGVVFLDTALGNRDAGSANSYFDINTDGTETEQPRSPESAFARGGVSPGQVRAFNDQYQPAKVLAKSVSENTHWTATAKVPDGKTIQTLISLYSKGNIWYLDDEGYFSSIEQVDQVNGTPTTNVSGKRRSRPPFDVARQTAEANLLSRTFENARQIIFLPLWDAGGNRWFSGCFVWSQSAIPVFTVDSEIAYLSAFTNSMMVEISRLEAITANKMKSDFISSISHEFRSPLHGILASTEFLRDSELDSMQAEFISTIQNCGSTLLDTINHVLDYSKINSFEKKGRESGALSNELYQTGNVALLCEEIVYGMMAAKEFQGITDSSTPQKSIHSKTMSSEPRIHIILDFEHRDWNYRIQSGAIRRIIMNIFGNANKYTDSGFIMVQLRVREVEMRDEEAGTCTTQHTLILKILDSGRGMSTEYMERKLYTPFAQEDSFAPGIGLGLSIVWSIINQLGGTIHIRSELGKGTDVEVNLPLERGDPNNVVSSTMAQSDIEVYGSVETQQCLNSVQKIAPGRTVAILRGRASKSGEQSHVALGWQCIEKYFATWFGFTIINPEDSHASLNADLFITEKVAQSLSSHFLADLDASRLLLIREGMTCIQERKSSTRNRSFESIWNPIGPYKLARAVFALFKDQPWVGARGSVAAPPTASSGIKGGMEMFQMSSGTSSEISTPLSSIKEDTPHDTDKNDIRTEELPDPVAVAPRSQRPVKPRPLHTNGIITATDPITPTDHSATQALQIMQALSTPTVPSPVSSVSPFTPTIRSPTSNDTPLHVLAVDDNTLNLQLLQRFLHKRSQDTVVTARNGNEAVAAVRRAAARPFDVIFMDLSMPEMDGFEATRLIRMFEKSLRHRDPSEACEKGTLNEQCDDVAIPVAAEGKSGDMGFVNGVASESSTPTKIHAYIIALTGLASRRDRDEAEESGFDDFLTKPISFGRIGEVLARLSAERGSEEVRLGGNTEV